jgi:hypothetical protein
MHFEPIAIGYIVAAVALVAEHVLLWPMSWRIERPWTYVMGVLTLLFGCFVWARIVRRPVDPMDALTAFALICTSGKWVIAAYWFRDRDAKRKQAAELTGKAIALAQDLIGGQDATTRSSRSDHRRN